MKGIVLGIQLGCDENLINKLINFLPYNPKHSRGLSKVFNKVGLTLDYKLSDSLRHILGNPKDKIPNSEKSGIYEIRCNDCDKKYIKQTRISIKTRFKENLAQLRYGRTDK